MAKYMSRSLALSTVYRHLHPQSNVFYTPRLQPIRFEHGKHEPKLPRPELPRPSPNSRPKGNVISWRTVGVFGAAASVLLGALAYLKDTKDKGVMSFNSIDSVEEKLDNRMTSSLDFSNSKRAYPVTWKVSHWRNLGTDRHRWQTTEIGRLPW